MAWTDAEARQRLERMLAWDTDPQLTQAEIDDLLQLAKRADAYGLGPDDPDWTPTYDLNAAAAEGWRWKAGKATGRYDLSDGGDSLSRSQVREACLEQARTFDAKVTASVAGAGPWAGDNPGVIGNLEP